MPSGAYIDTSSPEKFRHDDLVRTFNELLSGLPPIDGWSIEEVTLDYTSIGHSRIELLDLGEPLADDEFRTEIEKPFDQIADYRHRFNRARSYVVRRRVEELVAKVDSILPPLSADWEPSSTVVDDKRFEEVRSAFSELDRLVGSSVPRNARWKDFSRHLAFGQAGDLHDIARVDWPSVRSELQRLTADESEPIPVHVSDLSDLVRARPRGSVTTHLFLSKLDAEEFERLIFNLVLDIGECENVEWLMHTNAPDRGRDISAYLVLEDGLSGVRRERVIVQCKHWQPGQSHLPMSARCWHP